MARLSGLTPLKFRDATYVGPTLTYFVSSKISKVTKSGTSNAGFNYLTAGIGFPGSFDDWIVNESVATVLADSADGGTPLQYAFTVLSIDGVVPDSNTQTQNLNIDNILYMSDDTNGNANIVYKDNSNMSPVIYVVSGSSASLATLINTTDVDVTAAGNNAFTGNNTHAGTESFSNAAGVTTNDLTPRTAGVGTHIQKPIIQGQTFAAPVTLTAAQSGSKCISDAAAGTKWILPPAIANNIGVYFEFYVGVTVTSNSFDVEGATSADLFVAEGCIFQTKAATDGAYYSPNGSSNYKLTSNGTTTGGIVGDKYVVECIGLNKWLVTGMQSASGTVATPFAG